MSGLDDLRQHDYFSDGDIFVCRSYHFDERRFIERGTLDMGRYGGPQNPWCGLCKKPRAMRKRDSDNSCAACREEALEISVFRWLRLEDGDLEFVAEKLALSDKKRWEPNQILISAAEVLRFALEGEQHRLHENELKRIKPPMFFEQRPAL